MDVRRVVPFPRIRQLPVAFSLIALAIIALSAFVPFGPLAEWRYFPASMISSTIAGRVYRMSTVAYAGAIDLRDPRFLRNTGGFAFQGKARAAGDVAEVDEMTFVETGDGAPHVRVVLADGDSARWIVSDSLLHVMLRYTRSSYTTLVAATRGSCELFRGDWGHQASGSRCEAYRYNPDIRNAALAFRIAKLDASIPECSTAMGVTVTDHDVDITYQVIAGRLVLRGVPNYLYRSIYGDAVDHHPECPTPVGTANSRMIATIMRTAAFLRAAESAMSEAAWRDFLSTLPAEPTNDDPIVLGSYGD